MKHVLTAVVLIFMATPSVWAKHKKLKKAEVSRDIHFDDATVHGRYQMADEGVATVENEKKSAELLDMRMDFKDRLKKESERR